MVSGEHPEADWLDLLQGMERQGRAFWREAAQQLAAAPNLPGGEAGDAFAELWRTLKAENAGGEQLDAAIQRIHRQLDAAFTLVGTAVLPGAVAAAFRKASDQPGGDEHDPPLWLMPWLATISRRLGPFRKQQQQWDELLAALDHYQEAARRCTALLHGAAREGVTRFQARLHSVLAGETAAPEQLRDLYEIWLTEGEAAYEALLAEEAWTSAFADLSNASAELLRALREHADHYLSLLDLPNRRDLVDTQRRLLELERHRRRAEDGHENAELLREVKALRRELAALKKKIGHPS